MIGFRFTYDGANRLTVSQTLSGSGAPVNMYSLPVISYDAVGNITAMQRKGVDGNMMDNFTYTYQSGNNHLASITNAVNSTSYGYTYDNNGNVTSDQLNSITGIQYNIKNLPEQLTNNENNTVSYWYDGSGNRIRKIVGEQDELYVLGASGETEAVFNANGTLKFFNIIAGAEVIGRYEPAAQDSLIFSNTTLKRTYLGNHDLTHNTVAVPKKARLVGGTDVVLKPDFTTADSSRFTAKIKTSIQNPLRYYYLKDHLGSVRVTIDQTGEIVSYDDYDPWGMQLEGRCDNLADGNDKLKFTSKERDIETGYDWFNPGRYYDSRIGMWRQVDPLSYKSPGISGYCYVNNNPLKFIDPKGMEAVYWNGIPISSNALTPVDEMNRTQEDQNGNDGDQNKNKKQNKEQKNNVLKSGSGSDIKAAQEAIQKIIRISILFDLEMGGWIYKAGDKYYSTESLVGLQHEIDLGKPPKGAVGAYHTHGDASLWYTGEQFSGEDFEYIKVNIPGGKGFLGTPSGKFLMYEQKIHKVTPFINKFNITPIFDWKELRRFQWLF